MADSLVSSRKPLNLIPLPWIPCRGCSGLHRLPEHSHQLGLHGHGGLLSVVAGFEPLPEEFSRCRRLLEQHRLLAHVRDHLAADADPRAMQHHRDTDLAGLALTAAVAGGRTLSGHLGHGLNEDVEEKLFDLICRRLSGDAADADGHRYLAPQGIAGLVAKLEPALEKGRFRAAGR